MELTTAQNTKRATPGLTPSTVEPLKHQIMATLAQHRLASTVARAAAA